MSEHFWQLFGIREPDLYFAKYANCLVYGLEYIQPWYLHGSILYAECQVAFLYAE